MKIVLTLLRPLRSLRTRLLVFLLAAVLAAAAVQATIAYRGALREVDDIFDYHMQQMALSLRTGAPLAGPALPGGNDGEFEFLIQIWTADGANVFDSAPAMPLPQLAVLGFSNTKARGSTYRVFSLQTPLQTIQIAQDLAVRQRMATGFALANVAPIALFAPVLMLVVWWVVTRSFAPVTRTRAQIAARAADDLAPISAQGLPDEIQPLVDELNLLFGRVRSAFDAQKSFVADAAHELRSPLTALRLQVETLQRAGDDATRTRAVERLEAGIDRAARLVEQLLVLARQEASATAPRALPRVDLAALARSAVTDAQEIAAARAVDLGLVHADSASIAGDADALRILLRNLLDNAIKYAPNHGRVDVAVHAADGAAELTVDDDGPGIAPADRERAFDRFYRASGAPVGGSGLGLAIVRAIADRHHARVTLESAPTLGGLRVRIAFTAG